MKYFLYAVSKKLIVGFIFVSFMSMIDSMDVLDSPDDLQEVTFLKKTKIWDNERAVVAGQRWKDIVPGDIAMTPDETGALISWLGRVDYVNFKTMQQSEPYPLNRHNHKKYYPLVAAAMKKNTLKVISVMNNGQGAECIISSNKISHHPDHKSHNVFEKNVYRVIPLKGLVQGVALSTSGDNVVIAYKKSIEIINLATKERRESNFMPHDQGAFIVAVSSPVSMKFGQNQQSVAAANTKGVIDLKTMGEDESKDFVFKQFKDVKAGITIKEIRCSSQELLCVTSDNKIAIININDLLEHSHGSIKYRTIEGCSSCKVSIGNNFSDKNLSTVHWRGDASKSEDIRFKVELRRENGTSSTFSIFSLLQYVSKKYCRINDKGLSEEVPSHVLECRVGDNHAMVLVTDGDLYFFKLPQQYKIPTENDVTGLGQAELYRDKVIRGRSFSVSAASSLGEKHKNEKRNSGKKGGISSRIGLGSPTRSKESIKQSVVPRRLKNTSERESQLRPAQNEAEYIKSLIDDIKSDAEIEDEI